MILTGAPSAGVETAKGDKEAEGTRALTGQPQQTLSIPLPHRARQPRLQRETLSRAHGMLNADARGTISVHEEAGWCGF